MPLEFSRRSAELNSFLATNLSTYTVDRGKIAYGLVWKHRRLFGSLDRDWVRCCIRRGPRLRHIAFVAGWIEAYSGTDGRMIMVLLVLVFVLIGDFMDAVPAIIIFMLIIIKLNESPISGQTTHTLSQT
jgi:hypothetical protein